METRYTIYDAVRADNTHAAQDILSDSGFMGDLNELYVSWGNEDAFKLRKDNRVSMLHVAAMNGNVPLVNLLVNGGADVNIPGSDSGRSPLTYAVIAGRMDVVEALLRAGCDANSRCVYDVTPLHEACRCGHVEIAELLLDHGADVNAQDCGGVTPSMWLVSWFIPVKDEVRIRLLQRLITMGFDLNLFSFSEGTTLHAAVWNTTLTEFLLKAGADPDISTVTGETPLISAVEQDNTDAVQLLIYHNCDVNIRKTRDGLGQPLSKPEGALEIALTGDSYECVYLLLRAGYRVSKELFSVHDRELKMKTGGDSVSTDELRQCLFECANIPARLESQARLKLRSCLGRNLKDVYLLPLPRSLIEFITKI